MKEFMIGDHSICMAHQQFIIAEMSGNHNQSLERALDTFFALISGCEGGRDVKDLLEGPICNGGFKRLN